MTTRREQIISKALEFLKGNPNGIRYSKLVNMIKDSLREIQVNTIHGTIWNLDVRIPNEVYKPSRGIFRHTSFRGVDTDEITAEAETRGVSEEDFYEPFKKYLERDLGECTKAITLGGNIFRDKWGTPDVIGKNIPNPSDIIKFEPEIVSAEIKLDTSGTSLITAFGQACAYKLFSHKVYLVIPESSSEDDKFRIEALCQIFGIGLILFDSTNPEKPDIFTIRARAIKQQPDMSHVNKYMKLIERELFR